MSEYFKIMCSSEAELAGAGLGYKEIFGDGSRYFWDRAQAQVRAAELNAVCDELGGTYSVARRTKGDDDDDAYFQAFLEDGMVMTVADLLEEYGFGMVLAGPENWFLRDIKASCHVGEEADKAIQAGHAFASTLQPHPSVKAKVGAALAEHIRILYHG